ncbi:prenylated rab acceptor PRA1 [Rhizophagus diaphanus]|nr:prenylated rab acceptor PRA1 [Rhizophagus diaphanus] [Rhizophagus sp. MUCL 43196]
MSNTSIPSFPNMPSMPASFSESLPISPERINRFRSERLGNIRPLNEFFDRDRLSKPKGMGDIAQRLSYNLTHFQSNYIIIILGLLIYCMITNPYLLFAIIFIMFGLHFIRKMPPDQPLVFGQYVLTQKQLYTGLIIISIPLLWISSLGSTIFWIVGASGTLILGHAAFLEPGVDSSFASTADQV